MSPAPSTKRRGGGRVTTLCKPFFDPMVRERGTRYFLGGRVTVLPERVTSRSLATMVKGSGGRAYRVEVRWESDDMLYVDVECDCPHFTGGAFCKHVYASLLALDRHESSRAFGQHDLALLHHPFGRTDEDGNGGSGTNGVDPRGADTAPWRRLLAPVPPARDPMLDAWLAPSRPQARRQAWFVVNVGQSREAGALVIDYYHRREKKDGSFGLLKKQAVTHDDLELFSDPEDRSLVELLMVAHQVADGAARYSSWTGRHGPGGITAQVRGPTLGWVLPRLAATGRLVRQAGRDMSPASFRVLAYAPEPAWQFELGCEDVVGDSAWRFSGRLVREGVGIDLESCLLTLDDGFVMLDDGFYTVAGGGRWLNVFGAHPHVDVPHHDRESFLVSWWAAEERPPVELPPGLALTPVDRDPLPCLRVSPRAGIAGGRVMLAAEVVFDYDGNEVAAGGDAPLVDLERGRVFRRDAEQERAHLAALTRAGVREVSYRLDGEAAFELPDARLGAVTGRLMTDGWRVVVDGNAVRVAKPPVFEVSSGIDWFDLFAEVDFDGESVALPAVLAAIAAGEQAIRLRDGSVGLIPADWQTRFGDLLALGEAAGEGIRFRNAQALLLDALLAEQGGRVDVDATFSRWRERLSDSHRLEPADEPTGFEGTLRPYQKEGLAWLRFLYDLDAGGCLADDMGLGKTVQVLALLQGLEPGASAAPPHLVVVPRSLVHNWMEEAARFAPRLRVLDYTGPARGRLRPRFGDHDLIVTTYGTVRRDAPKLRDDRFGYVILDEAQAIKNATSQAAKACRLLQADRRLVMTGTPVENHLGDLWSLFEFLNPGVLGRARAFQQFSRSASTRQDPEALDRLARGLAPFILRRTKEQVLTDLPEKSEQTIVCELPTAHRKLYDELRDHYRAVLSARVSDVGLGRSRMHVLEALLRLRQVACHPGLLDPTVRDTDSAKTEALLESLEEVVEGGHKALVFSQFTSFLDIVRRRLDRAGITTEYLDGRTRDRAKRIARFQEDPDCPVFLISLKAGGVGLNLTAADYVFVLDPWWNPAAEAQAIDRAHRIGQRRPVFAYRLICEDTVEEKIVALQSAKRDLADAIVREDRSVLASMTPEDLHALLS